MCVFRAYGVNSPLLNSLRSFFSFNLKITSILSSQIGHLRVRAAPCDAARGSADLVRLRQRGRHGTRTDRTIRKTRDFHRKSKRPGILPSQVDGNGGGEGSRGLELHRRQFRGKPEEQISQPFRI